MAKKVLYILYCSNTNMNTNTKNTIKVAKICDRVKNITESYIVNGETNDFIYKNIILHYDQIFAKFILQYIIHINAINKDLILPHEMRLTNNGRDKIFETYIRIYQNYINYIYTIYENSNINFHSMILEFDNGLYDNRILYNDMINILKTAVANFVYEIPLECIIKCLKNMKNPSIEITYIYQGESLKLNPSDKLPWTINTGTKRKYIS